MMAVTITRYIRKSVFRNLLAYFKANENVHIFETKQ